MERESLMWDIFNQTGSVGAYLLYKRFGELSQLGEEQNLPRADEEEGI